MIKLTRQEPPHFCHFEVSKHSRTRLYSQPHAAITPLCFETPVSPQNSCITLKLLYHPKGPSEVFPQLFCLQPWLCFLSVGVLCKDITDEQESYGARPPVPAIVHVSCFQVPSTWQLLGHCSLSRLEIVLSKQTPLGVASSVPNSGCFLLPPAVKNFGPTRLYLLQYLFFFYTTREPVSVLWRNRVKREYVHIAKRTY